PAEPAIAGHPGGDPKGRGLSLPYGRATVEAIVVTSRNADPRRAGSRSYPTKMIWYSRENAAERGGVEPDYLVRLVDLGVLVPGEPDRFSPGVVRRVLMAKSLEDAGIPLDGVAAAIQRGAWSLELHASAGPERFPA